MKAKKETKGSSAKDEDIQDEEDDDVDDESKPPPNAVVSGELMYDLKSRTTVQDQQPILQHHPFNQVPTLSDSTKAYHHHPGLELNPNPMGVQQPANPGQAGQAFSTQQIVS